MRQDNPQRTQSEAVGEMLHFVVEAGAFLSLSISYKVLTAHHSKLIRVTSCDFVVRLQLSSLKTLQVRSIIFSCRGEGLRNSRPWLKPTRLRTTPRKTNSVVL